MLDSLINNGKIFSLIAAIMMFLGFILIFFIYYFNKFYTSKFKNDFFYLFWGMSDYENKLSANDYLSLFIYKFLIFYLIEKFSFKNGKYSFFPMKESNLSPPQSMPNAYGENLKLFENKHLKWIIFNILICVLIFFSAAWFMIYGAFFI